MEQTPLNSENNNNIVPFYEFGSAEGETLTEKQRQLLLRERTELQNQKREKNLEIAREQERANLGDAESAFRIQRLLQDIADIDEDIAENEEEIATSHRIDRGI